MARSRNIKPGIMENEVLAELDPIARLLFIYLWMLADREGRLEDRPKRIRAKALPYDSADVDALLNDLQDKGFLIRYEAKGQKYIQITNFLKHQKPHSNEIQSEIPPWEEELATKVASSSHQNDQGGIPRPKALGPCISDSLIDDCLIACKEQEANASVNSDAAASEVDAAQSGAVTAQTGDSNAEVARPGTVTPSSGDPQRQRLMCPAEQLVDAYHELMPDNPRVKVLNDARKRSIAARWREAAKLSSQPFGYATVAEGLAAWREFFAICAESPFLTGKVPAKPGQLPFLADIDFLMSPSGFAKCLENKYHREVA
jgi:hypothetical protein